MSAAGDRLQDVVDKALGEFAADEGGGLVTGYSIVVDYLDDAGEHSWAVAHADAQRPATTLGLLRWATIAVEEDVRRYFRQDDERG